MIRIALIVFFAFLIQSASAQVSLQSVLDSISVNNLQIKASSQNRDTEISSARTGLTPADPQVDYGYFPGSNSEIGTKTTLSISQSFNFPTFYARKKDGAVLFGEKYKALHRNNIRHILFDAASLYIELVYQDKYCSELKKRSDDAEAVKIMFDKRVQKGDANQLELNKVQMEALHWSNELSIAEARRMEKKQILTAMNGGRAIPFANPEYPMEQLLPVDTILARAIHNDPILRAMGFDQQIAGNNVKLQKALWLPQFKAGYGQETILNGSYRGVQAGISIPLWQNKNTVKQAQLQQQSTESSAVSYLQQLQTTINAKYQVVFSLKKNLDEYRKITESIHSKELLQKSLNSGNISVLEYYRELSAWYEAYDRFLQSTRDYNIEMVYLRQYEW
ncbi:MAG: TolC family protein [Mariniphaga sp.]